MNSYTRLTLIGFLLFMARGMTGPLSSLYWRSLGASYVAIGLLGTVTSITSIAFSYFWGRASDRAGQRRLFLFGGLAGLAVSFGLLVGATDAALLFPIHALSAIAQTAYGIASLALMGDWLEHRERQREGVGRRSGAEAGSGRRMGTYRGLSSLGFGLMAFISGSIAEGLSLRVPYALATAFHVIALVLALGVREAPAEGDAHVRMGKAAPVPQPTAGSHPGSQLPLTPLLVSALIWSLVTGAVYAVWGNYMVDDIGYTPGQMTRIWALASLSEFPLMIVAGWMSDRIGRLPMLAVGFVAWTVVFMGYIVAPGMPFIVLIQLTRGFAYSAYTATSMIYAAEVRSRAERGRMSGIYGTAGALGSILGSSLGGAITQYAGFRALIGASAALVFAGAIYLGSVAIRRAATQSRATAAPIQ
ncbi:MAG: MFS transporter [Anaerolineae bacterium]|nr:MFS transporter [Anaerolineae bacterium]